MLHRVHIVRLAFQHSPEKEQRLLSRQSGSWQPQKPNENQRGGFEQGESSSPTSKHIEKIQSTTRQRLSFLNDLAQLRMGDEDAQNAILSTFFSEHKEFLDKYFKENLGREFTPEYENSLTVDSLQQQLDVDVRQMMARSIENMGPKFNFYITEQKFARAFMRSVLKMDKDTEISDEELNKFTGQNYVPSAFVIKGTIHLNMDHVDFNFEKKFDQLRKSRPTITEDQVLEIVEKNRDRAIVHEIGHYCLDRKDKDGTRLTQLAAHMKTTLGVKELDQSPEWQSLKLAVESAFDGKFGEKPTEEYLHEALAIYTAAKKYPLEKDDKERAVVQAFEKLYQTTSTNPRIRQIVDEFQADVVKQTKSEDDRESPLDFGRRKMAAASAERTGNLLFKQKFEEHECGAPHTNKPENNQVKDEMVAETEKSATTLTKPEDVEKAISESLEKLKKMKSGKDEFMQLIPAEAREAESQAFDNLVGKFDKESDDIQTVRQDNEILAKWDDPSALTAAERNAFAKKWNFDSLGTYDDKMSASDIITMNAANRIKREDILNAFSSSVATYFEPIKSISALMEDEILKKQDAELRSGAGGNVGMIGWLRQKLGQQNGITWLSWYDIVKIVNIYKDAIVERYQSNQKVRTYDAAKSWNLWTPLQPDLDKQAKSANDEETEKFKEYLKKDGFTYTQLFEPNGIMDQNRGNINRAKAVIDYAADHAWLYKLDRFNGHDVYGLDYQGLWGDRTFEELVEQNAGQQDKESKAGYSKVNNHPEIPMIVDDMIEAIKKKNLWQVHGMMNRLQEKAKLAESNTWAVTTLYRALREDPEVLDIIDIGMLDKIGNLGIGQSAWALTLYKVQRKQIVKMKASAGKEATRDGKIAAAKKYSDGDEDFVMGQTISKIESLLPPHLKNKVDKEGKPSFKDLDREVAKVLAGQTVFDANGQAISIFDPDIKEFNNYREFYHKITDTTPTEPKKTDPDFFNPGNGGSDLLLLGQNEVGNVLGHQSQGPWIEESKANNFMTQVFMRDEELKISDPSGRLQASFRTEMKRKFALYLNSKVLAQAAAMNYVAKVRTNANPEIDNKFIRSHVAGKLVLLELKKRGMIEEDVFKKIREKGGSDTSDDVKKEYLNDDPTSFVKKP